MRDPKIGSTVRFTDHHGRERVGVLRDCSRGRLSWRGRVEYLVQIPDTPLGEPGWFWTGEVNKEEEQ